MGGFVDFDRFVYGFGVGWRLVGSGRFSSCGCVLGYLFFRRLVWVFLDFWFIIVVVILSAGVSYLYKYRIT